MFKMSQKKSTKKRFHKLFIRHQKNKILKSWTQKFYGYTDEKLHWFQVVLRLQTSILLSIIPWIFFFSAYGFLVSLLEYHEAQIPLPKIGAGVPNIVLSFNLILSLLLIFRTNTAYERFWEGRKLWGSLVNTVRNLTRGNWIVIKECSVTNRTEKEAASRLVVAFAIATKLHLRRELVNEELMPLMSSFQYSKLKNTNHPPLEIAFWLGEYLQYQHERNLLNVYQLTALQKLVDDLVDILGGCERILKTPMPLAYAIYLKQLLVVYCLILPVELVSSLNWWTAPVMAFISLILFGIEEIGSELENPFGHDPNDLPLDIMCNTMLHNVKDLVPTATNKNSFY